jgi:ribosomal protein S18 acetylase RimI-like enzyme
MIILLKEQNSMEKLTIRTLESSDAEDYIRIRLEALQESPSSFLSTYEETIVDPTLLETYKQRIQPTDHAFSLGAFEGGQLVSIATLIRETRIKVQHKAEIYAVYTTPTHRGKGISKALIKELIKRGKQMPGLEKIELTVVTSNEPAYRLYTSLGFCVYGTEKHALKHNNEYWDEYDMVLFLS